MQSKYKISTNLTPFSERLDRFVPSGYVDSMTLEKSIKIASKIKGLNGLEFLYPVQFEDPKHVKELIDGVGLKVSCIQVDVFSNREWRFGSLSSTDNDLRRKAIDLSKKSMDIASELGASRILLWLGHDGYDYVFQTDYYKAWDHLISSLSEIAGYHPDMRVSIEYKVREPRTRIHIGNMGTALVAVKEAKQSNLGVIIDIGHSLMAYENLAEMALLAHRLKALHGFHLNDCFRYADDDLVMGTVHIWEYVELFYWMLQIGYSDWWTLDTYPYREDGIKVIEQSIEMFNVLMGIAEKLDIQKINPLQLKSDALAIFDILRKASLTSTE